MAIAPEALQDRLLNEINTYPQGIINVLTELTNESIMRGVPEVEEELIPVFRKTVPSIDSIQAHVDVIESSLREFQHYHGHIKNHLYSTRISRPHGTATRLLAQMQTIMDVIQHQIVRLRATMDDWLARRDDMEDDIALLRFRCNVCKTAELRVERLREQAELSVQNARAAVVYREETVSRLQEVYDQEGARLRERRIAYSDAQKKFDDLNRQLALATSVLQVGASIGIRTEKYTAANARLGVITANYRVPDNDNGHLGLLRPQGGARAILPPGWNDVVAGVKLPDSALPHLGTIAECIDEDFEDKVKKIEINCKEELLRHERVLKDFATFSQGWAHDIAVVCDSRCVMNQEIDSMGLQCPPVWCRPRTEPWKRFWRWLSVLPPIVSAVTAVVHNKDTIRTVLALLSPVICSVILNIAKYWVEGYYKNWQTIALYWISIANFFLELCLASKIFSMKYSNFWTQIVRHRKDSCSFVLYIVLISLPLLPVMYYTIKTKDNNSTQNGKTIGISVLDYVLIVVSTGTIVYMNMRCRRIAKEEMAGELKLRADIEMQVELSDANRVDADKVKTMLKYINKHVAEEFKGELVNFSSISFVFHVKMLLNVYLSLLTLLCSVMLYTDDTAKLGFGLAIILTFCSFLVNVTSSQAISSFSEVITLVEAAYKHRKIGKKVDISSENIKQFYLIVLANLVTLLLNFDGFHQYLDS